MSLVEQVTKELEQLPREKVGEVLDFIHFIKMRFNSQTIQEVSETALRPLWDTPEEDEAWKHL